MTAETDQMTKRELLELLKDIPDDATIGMWWNECEAPINGVSKGEHFDYTINC